MQLLKILVRCNIVRSDACRRAVFGIPSGPVAFLLGKVFMMDLTSFGVMGCIVGVVRLVEDH